MSGPTQFERKLEDDLHILTNHSLQDISESLLVQEQTTSYSIGKKKESSKVQVDANHSNPETTIPQNRIAVLPLKSVTVDSPRIKDLLVNSYIVYKVTFVWNDKELKVNRRYSDFKALRKSLSHLLPFTFIFPMHRKQAVVN
jgi:hypothetical protein